MRWWINTDSPRIMSIDNSSVKGMDYSSLSPNIWHVQWIEGKGEIELQTPDGSANLNGLRTNFSDLTPYVPYFNQFLTLLQAKGLALTESQKIKCDLIVEMFNEKRQLPVHYPVAAGDYWWPADDADVAAMSLKMMPVISGAISSGSSGANNIIDQMNTLVAQLNTLIDNINGHEANIIDQVNGNVVNGSNSAIVANGNTIVSQINSTVVGGVNANVVTPGNNALGAIGAALADVNSIVVTGINTYLIGPLNTLLSYIDNTLVGTFTGVGGYTNTINGALVWNGDNTTPYAQPGINGGVAHTGIAASPGIGGIPGNPYSMAGIAGVTAAFGALSALTHLSPLMHVGTVTPPAPYSAVIPWTPIDHASPVNITPTEMLGIMDAIATRRESLVAVETSKIQAIEALTTIAAVIAYNVTTGWPVIPLPP